MTVIPSSLLALWGFGVLGCAGIGGGVYLTRAWYQRSWVYDPQLERAIFAPYFGLNAHTALLGAGILLLGWSLAGGLIVGGLLRVLRRARPGDNPPRTSAAGEVHRLRQPDGSELHVCATARRMASRSF